MVPSNDARRFRHILRESKNVVAVVGAGLSVASGQPISKTNSFPLVGMQTNRKPLSPGIPTWRGSGRSWKHKDPASLSSPETFASHPELVWQHYHELRERCVRTVQLKTHVSHRLNAHNPYQCLEGRAKCCTLCAGSALCPFLPCDGGPLRQVHVGDPEYRWAR